MIYKMTMADGSVIPTTRDKEILVKTCPNFKGSSTGGMFSLTETTAKYGGGIASYSMVAWFITQVEEVAGSFVIYQRAEENRKPFILTPVEQ